MEDVDTQRFYVVLATDGDVSEREIGEVLDALGYHGILVLDRDKTDSHEHPCPSWGCISQLRAKGHAIPDGTNCCICWGRG
jgi:hypothetical protein